MARGLYIPEAVRWFGIFISILMAADVGLAADACKEAYTGYRDGSWAVLRRLGFLVNQAYLEGRENLCSPASIFHLKQSMALKLGAGRLYMPSTDFEPLVDRWFHDPRGMDTGEIVVAAHGEFHQSAGPGRVLVTGYLAAGVKDIYPNAVHRFVVFDPQWLIPSPTESVLAIVKLLNVDGDAFHTIAVEAVEDNLLAVVDPSAPGVEVRARRDGDFSFARATVPKYFYEDQGTNFAIIGVVRAKKLR